MIGWFAAALLAVSSLEPGADAVPAAHHDQTALAEAQDNLDKAELVYAQSCGDRAYGAYDDLCDTLSKQVRQYRVDLDKLQRAARQASSGR